MKKGFTLIEVLVATLLLSMLVTILTMIFNQSSIAWSTGLASVTALGNTREKMSVLANESENAMLSDDGGAVLRITSVWAGAGKDFRVDGRTLSDDFEWTVPQSNLRDPMTAGPIPINGNGGGNASEGVNSGGNSGGRETFLVGVHSYGPDGKTGGDYSWDDISTMPEEIVK